MQPIEKVVHNALVQMAKHKNAEHLQKLITVFDCECEHLKSYEYLIAPEMVKIIEDSKPKNKKANGKRKSRGTK